MGLFYPPDAEKTHRNRYTPEASELSDRVCAALKPIFDDFVQRGFSPREISHIVMLDVMMLEMEAIL